MFLAEAIAERKLPCDINAPFGLPVVPEV